MQGFRSRAGIVLNGSWSRDASKSIRDESGPIMSNALKQLGWSLALILGSISGASSGAQNTESRAPAQSQAPHYASVLKQCGRDGRAQFLKAFDGLWPLPSNFVLLDTSNEQLEYSDRAFPWSCVRQASIVFHGRRERIEGRWPDLFFGAGRPRPGKCGLDVRRHDTSIEFGRVVVVISGPREHLLLVGPIAEVASSAMECYALTLPRGRSCT